MKIIINISLLTFIFFLNTFLSAQGNKSSESANTDQEGKTQLLSDELVTEGQQLDQEIEKIYKKINDVISNYKLLEIKDIKFLPYRTTYNVGNDFIEIEKYELLRNTFVDDKVLGINKKNIKVYISGDSISKLETQLVEQYLYTGTSDRVIITDPSPNTSGTDDMMFTHISRNVKIMENKKLADIKNNRVSPLRNNIKKEFIIPHIIFLYDTLLDIAETYYKGLKDSDRMLSDFLKKSTNY